ncbi:VWA domain-containing protein [Actinomadura alba]|uniref:VWA domain-containing protein n=1 Tax=Actinomadura alba TaxID=406431 RepID=A0ABR7M1T8_9ACTN|nr:VWA domain-containing protein [Actinomadura alba]
MLGSGNSGRRRISALLVVVAFVSVLSGCSRGAQSDCDGAVRLRMAASQDKVGLLQKAADEFGKQASVDGKCVKVTVDSKNSGTAMQALARGWDESVDGPRPDVWSPASSVWITLLRQRVQALDKAPPVADGTPQPIMTTPLTIAMPKPMAQVLGWPGKAIGWSDLAKLATDPKGWAAYGHPEWGEFRLGKTNPNLSTSGLNATVGAYFAITGTTSDLGRDDIANPKNQAFVRNIERSIVHYGDTALTFLTNLQRADDRGEALSYISAITIEEDFVWAYNQGNPTLDPSQLGKHAKPKIPLVAIYPKEGTILSDHPYVPMNGLDPAKKRASDAFLTYLHGERSQKLFQRHGYRDHQGRPGEQATQANGLLRDQPTTMLTVPQPGVLDSVLETWAELRKPAKVLLVVDRSGSMREEVAGTGKSKGDLAKAAAAESLGEFRGHDEVGLWMFSAQLDGQQDWRQLVPVASMDAAHRASMRTALNQMTLSGATGLYNTTAAAYDTMRAGRKEDSINAVVVLTDGQNERQGGLDLDTLLGKLSNKDGEAVRVFTIGYGANADQNVLRQIAQATEGAAYDASDANSIREVFQEVISNF